MKELVEYLLKNLYIDFQGEISVEQVREFLRQDDSREARKVLAKIIDPGLDAAARDELADTVATFTDRRVQRYWHLLGVLNGWPPAPSQVEAFEWFIEGLRAHP